MWEFTKHINSAQNQAERRREFYVALTRVENHLIIVGNSTNNGQICSETGMIQFTSKPSDKTMGHMWMEGLRSIAHKQNQPDSPWLKSEDAGVEELGEYGEHEVSIDPVCSTLIPKWEKATYGQWLSSTTQTVFQIIHQRRL